MLPEITENRKKELDDFCQELKTLCEKYKLGIFGSECGPWIAELENTNLDEFIEDLKYEMIDGRKAANKREIKREMSQELESK